MFEILFGWRKASTCKKLIRKAQRRLKLLKNKRDSIIRQFREDVVQLIKNGHHDSALSRIEQLYKDQNMKDVYDQLDSFCEFIIINLPYIRRHKDFPNDINEAVSSLLYASARFGDLPELIKLRKLFGERYGQRFAVTAVELSYGNLVNRQIIENLCMKSIPDDLKLKLMKAIASDNGIQLDHLETYAEFEMQHNQISDLSMVKYDLEWTEHASERDPQRAYDRTDGSKLYASSDKELTEIYKSDYSVSEWMKKGESLPSDSCFVVVKESTGTTASVQSALDIVQASTSSRIHESSVNTENIEEITPLYEDEMVSGSQHHKVEIIAGAASESPSRLSERSIVYLDDVEELQHSTKEDVKDKDQRLFMSKSNITSVKEKSSDFMISLSGIYQDEIEQFESSEGKSSSIEHFESSEGKSSSRASSKKRKSSRKRSKRRYVLVENLSMKDVACALYYAKPHYFSPDDVVNLRSHPQRKHPQKMSGTESLSSPFTNYRKKLSPKTFYEWKVPDDIRCKDVERQNRGRKCKLNQGSCGDGVFIDDKAADCCLDHPCYFLTREDDIWENPYQPLRSGTKTSKHLPHINSPKECVEYRDHHFSSEDAFSTNVNTKHKGFRDSINTATSKVEEAEVIACQNSCASSHDSCSRVTSPWTRTRPPYSRAMTMPPDRPKETPKYQILRSATCLPKTQKNSNTGSPSYVHPKLPDYDDLSAQFKAIKKGQL